MNYPLTLFPFSLWIGPLVLYPLWMPCSGLTQGSLSCFNLKVNTSLLLTLDLSDDFIALCWSWSREAGPGMTDLQRDWPLLRKQWLALVWRREPGARIGCRYINILSILCTSIYNLRSRDHDVEARWMASPKIHFRDSEKKILCVLSFFGNSLLGNVSILLTFIPIFILTTATRLYCIILVPM